MDPMSLMTLASMGMNLYNGISGNIQQNRLMNKAFMTANDYMSLEQALNMARNTLNPDFSQRLAEAQHGIDQQMLSRGMYGQPVHAMGMGSVAAANERARLSAIAQLGGQIRDTSMNNAMQRANMMTQGAGLAGNRANAGMSGFTSMGNNWMDKNTAGVETVFNGFGNWLKGGGATGVNNPPVTYNTPKTNYSINL